MASEGGDSAGRQRPGSAEPWLPAPWLRAGHLVALWAFAFVQPLFDLLGRNAEFFVARGNGRADILIFAFAFALAPPLAMLAIEELVGRASRRAMAIVHLALVALLAAAFVLGAMNESSGLPAALQIALALAVGAGVALAYRALDVVRSLATFLTLAPAVFLAIFLLFSEATDLIRPAPDVETFAAVGERDAPVLLIVFDELPVATLMDSDGTIDGRRFPNFARLADTSTWYRQATTVADRTAQAVPAILTGQETSADLGPTLGDHPRNLFTLFAGAYPLNVWESATRLCPVSACDRSGDPLATRLRSLASDLRVVSQHLLLPESLTADLPPIDQAFFGFGDTEESRYVEGLDSERLAGLLEGLDRTAREPSFNFVHFDTPHVPWRWLPSGRSCQSETWDLVHMLDADGAWIDDRWATLQALGAHLLQAGYADRLLGRVIDRLEQQGVWNRAAVVVVADHGVAFEPGGLRRTLTAANAGATLRVPLFVKAPGQRRGEVSGRHARTVDVLPTIAEMVAAELPFAVDGVPADAAPSSAVVTASGQPLDALKTIPRVRLERTRARLTERKERLLGPRGSLREVFAMGPEHDLVGAATGPFGSGAVDGSYELVGADAYTDVEPTAEIPCQLVAKLEGVDEGEPLAVAVNGRVVATTRTYAASSGIVQAFALVDPRSFQPGDNQVELWRIVESAGARPELAPLAAG